jgi:hypothetical protein
MRKVTIAFAATIALLVAGVLAWNAQAAPFAGLPPQIITHQSKGWGAADLDVAHGDVPGSAAPVVAGAHLVGVGAATAGGVGALSGWQECASVRIRRCAEAVFLDPRRDGATDGAASGTSTSPEAALFRNAKRQSARKLGADGREIGGCLAVYAAFPADLAASRASDFACKWISTTRGEMFRVQPHRLPVIGDLMPRRRPFHRGSTPDRFSRATRQ